MLVFIGVLLVIEVVVAWPSPGLPLGDLGRMALGVGADIRTAGTLSLFISMPSVLVGLASQRAQLVAAARI